MIWKYALALWYYNTIWTYGTVPFRYHDDILVRAFKTPQDFAQWQHRMALWQPSSHPQAMGHPKVCRGFQGFTAGNWQQNTSTKYEKTRMMFESPFELNQTSQLPDSDLNLHLNNLNSTPPVVGIAKLCQNMSDMFDVSRIDDVVEELLSAASLSTGFIPGLSRWIGREGATWKLTMGIGPDRPGMMAMC